ncbi:glycerophosphodiester phosphodiesterase family protein [soil metagenome]
MKNQHKLVVVGHRGAKGLALENTAMSIEAAISYGVAQVEIDLRMTLDGRVVLLHDENAVARNGVIVHPNEQTYERLVQYFPDILTLEQLLPLVNHRCRIMLECKELAAVEPTVEILRTYFAKGWKPEEFMFASFKFNILEKFHALVPNVEIVVLDNWSSVRAVYRARKLGTSYLSMDQRYLWWGVIHSLSKHYKLFCYPNHKLIHIKHAKPAKWAKWGLYGVITDYPNFFLAKPTSSIVDSDESHISKARGAD